MENNMISNSSRKECLEMIKSTLLEGYNDGISLFDAVKNEVVNKDQFKMAEYYRFKLMPHTLDELPDQELLWIVNALHKHLPSVKAETYFTEHEIKGFKTYHRKEDENISQLYILRNAFQLAENQWTCVASIEQLALMRKYNILRIDPNFQREINMRRKTRGETDEILRKIKVNPSRIKEIKTALKNGDYYFNTIRINLMNDGESSLDLSQLDDGIIILPKNGDYIIPDGNHRSIADEQVYFDHPELHDKFRNQYFNIILTFYSPADVRKLISQEWNVEPVTKRHIESMKVNYTNLIIDMIKNNPDAERIYADSIVTTGNEVLARGGFILYDLLATAIKMCYNSDKFQLQSQSKEVATWLVEYFNYISTLLLDDMIGFKNERYHSPYKKWSVLPVAWTGYVYLSSVLRYTPNWKVITKHIINTTNWDYQYYIQSNIKKNSDILTIKAMCDFFEKEVDKFNV